MKGTNIILMNQATMLDAVNLWLADQFKDPPMAKSVKKQTGERHSDGFEITVTERELPDSK
jgi:dsRNA-specific ribonuclease